MQYLVLRFPQSKSLGIYNCRVQRGGSALSLHACGKAGDSGVPTKNNGTAADTAAGNPIVELLLKYANELGLCGIIYNRVRYDASAPKGKVYTGIHPHYDHIHWEQILSYARSLTLDKIIKICGPVTAPAPTPPTTPPATDWTDTVIMALPTLKKGAGMPPAPLDQDVKRLQGLLVASGRIVDVDGRFGDGTDSAVRNFQTARGLTVDGIVGQNTWTKLLGE